MKNKYYEVIVVGAGPAGSTAAYILSKLGFKVLIIDKSGFPRDKLCGGLITMKTSKLISRIFNLTQEEVNGLFDYSTNHLTVYFEESKSISSKSEIPFNLVKRKVYDYFFLSKALDAGAEAILGERVSQIDYETNTVFTDLGKKFSAKYIVGADGVNSVVRRSLPIFNSKEWLKNTALCVETFSKYIKTDVVQIYFGIVKHGYAWIFPNSDGSIIGMGGNLKIDSDIVKKFSIFIDNMNLNQTSKIMGHLIPYGNFMKKPFFKNIVLVGDAAGFVDSILGEGIFYAHRSGEIAAISIYKSIIENEPVGNVYSRLLKKYLMKQLSLSKSLRVKVFNNTLFYSVLIKFLESKDSLPSKVMEIIHGERLYNLERWNDCWNEIGF